MTIIKPKNTLPAGSERHGRADGMVQIKTEDGRWIYKQRYVWEKHNGAIPPKHFIIFADGDRTNYDIDNLRCVTAREASLMANHKLFSENSDCTDVGITVSKLIIKTKEKQGIKVGKSHKRKRQLKECK